MAIISMLRVAAVMFLVAGSVPCFIPDVHAAELALVDIGPMTITPDAVSPGQHPTIEARISKAGKTKGESISVNIVAVITHPDNRMRSWTWDKVRISRDVAKSITVPNAYDTSIAGTYRAEIIVYSGDMKHRYASQSRLFKVTDHKQIEKQKQEQNLGKETAAVGTANVEPERVYAAIGVYGNALNPAVGGTIYLWPSKYVGIQGLYSTGSFNTYEGRLIVRYDLSSKYAVYGGIGYINVTTDKNIIGVPTRFEDSGMSGVIGVEVTLGKKVLLYVESSAANIDLERTVTNGAQTVAASVKYSSVSIGGALVFAVF